MKHVLVEGSQLSEYVPPEGGTDHPDHFAVAASVGASTAACSTNLLK